jgi:glycosidase
MKVTPNGPLAKSSPNYNNLNNPDKEYAARLNCMKTDQIDTAYNYHHSAGMDWEQPSEQTGQIAGDCVDINTENQQVANYLTNTYMEYVDMGVDAFRLDTEKHINRWTLNNAYFPKFKGVNNFFIFGEVCARVRDTWNHGIQSDSPAFYGWAETESAWKNNWSTTNWQSNLTNSVKHFEAHNNESGAPTSTNAFLNSGNTYHTPDYSKSNGTGVIDFKMHWSFENASTAYAAALDEDRFFNDSTYNVMYVDSHDYGPDGQEKYRYKGGEQAWAENMNLMFTFRGIPCIFYGSEVQFKNDKEIDVGPNQPLENTGRAYFGGYLEGNVTASDFGKYSASGTVNNTLSKPLSKHLQQLNLIRRAVPALQKGQYASYGNMAYVRRYKSGSTDSLACVAVSGGATFKNLPNGKYIDAVTGDVKNVTNGTLSSPSIGKGNMRVYVCCASGFKGISGKIGTNGTYLK